MSAFIPRRAARVLAPLALVLLAACSQQELYGQLNERQANEMVAVLRNAGLVAEKTASRDGKAYVVSTSAHDFSRAVEVLHAGGFPRDSFDTLGQVFKKEGFVSSPTEERARFTHALSQELSHTLSNIDGVVQARVHVSVPDKNPLADKPTPATASVFIKHRPGVDLTQQVGKIKALVVNAMEGLPYDNVTVAMFPAEPIPPALPRSALAVAWANYGNAILAVGAAGALALLAAMFIWWRQRHPPTAPRGAQLPAAPGGAKPPAVPRRAPLRAVAGEAARASAEG
ncbi:type III secretion system inner membrane ring lipoprotein SctJ [Ottowia testudinis]|uniref:Lipoprotein n=1 Tax=Ottowia testudinis TaxID=2816950 RepID=A0A975CID3_9BURK|nr:type III secretion inner membrane ring lipoprotein SctJ [Ottowia testudinis]QTD45502.1 type III secretion inner membrane ring lipoprotein SctJ [Ottowia testudinis]